MSWQTTDFLSVDTTDFLSADTTDFLSADTTDFLSTDTTDVLSANTTDLFYPHIFWEKRQGPFGGPGLAGQLAGPAGLGWVLKIGQKK